MLKRTLVFSNPVASVCILTVTDKQYGDIVNVWGKIEAKKRPVQLTFDFF